MRLEAAPTSMPWDSMAAPFRVLRSRRSRTRPFSASRYLAHVSQSPARFFNEAARSAVCRVPPSLQVGPSLYSGLSPAASPNPLKHVFQMIEEVWLHLPYACGHTLL